ncbi:LysR family transcriptional regulator [Muricoccus nepalensis]|uniref:LysR family transcriptional regulator n=1 Tax=Muricoccus nepalensis TaxID=1854500 RepID=UPI0013872CBE|nr:LysR family transcriptional regulator [Roseomonas nepalensis]
MDRLRAALAVRDAGGVTAAADRLGLTQPAVSRLVSVLEVELGFAVFARERRRLVLTDRGRIYLAEAEASLGGLQRLAVLGRELRLGGRGIVRTAAVSVIAHGVLPRAVAALLRSEPDAAVEISEVERDEQVQGLLAARYDLGLLALPLGASGLQVDVLADAEAVCFLPEGHRLAKRRALTPADLAGERFIAHQAGKLMRQRVDDAFAQLGLERRVVTTTNSTALAAALVAAGVGLAIAHGLPRASLPAGVVTRPFKPRLGFGYAAATRTEERRGELVEALLRHVRDAMAEEDAGAVGPARPSLAARSAGKDGP